MKSFQFRLSRVLSWYRTQASLQQQALQMLFAEREQLLAEIQFLNELLATTHAELPRSQTLTGLDLRSWSAFRIRISNDLAGKTAHLEGCQGRIANQQKVLLEAKRKVEMLDRLRESQHRQWVVELTAEEQEIAEENYLSRMLLRDAQPHK